MTEEQKRAIELAHIDIVAGDDLFNGSDGIEPSAWEELGIAYRDTRRDLEREFPWLVQVENTQEDE